MALNGHYTIHGGALAQNGLGCALRDISLKQARKYATQYIWGALFYVEGMPPLKNRKNKSVCIIHYLKDIALETFEIRKAKLKNEGSDGTSLSL
ncbi:hypothetical protein [Bartonella sp. AU15XJBT]|uniref:hypothetical protein n=1 Tax=Bartonella sp. AU15XJBT TaxID=3019087 RepID=UPI003857AF31